MLTRNMQRVRDNLKSFGSNGGRSNSVASVSTLRKNSKIRSREDELRSYNSSSANGFTQQDVDGMNENLIVTRPSVVVTRKGPDLSGRNSSKVGKSDVTDQLDSVFDTLGTDDVESEYFTHIPKDNRSIFARQPHLIDTSSEMSLN